MMADTLTQTDSKINAKTAYMRTALEEWKSHQDFIHRLKMLNCQLKSMYKELVVYDPDFSITQGKDEKPSSVF